MRYSDFRLYRTAGVTELGHERGKTLEKEHRGRETLKSKGTRRERSWWRRGTVTWPLPRDYCEQRKEWCAEPPGPQRPDRRLSSHERLLQGQRCHMVVPRVSPSREAAEIVRHGSRLQLQKSNVQISIQMGGGTKLSSALSRGGPGQLQLRHVRQPRARQCGSAEDADQRFSGPTETRDGAATAGSRG